MTDDTPAETLVRLCQAAWSETRSVEIVARRLNISIARAYALILTHCDT